MYATRGLLKGVNGQTQNCIWRFSLEINTKHVDRKIGLNVDSITRKKSVKDVIRKKMGHINDSFPF